MEKQSSLFYKTFIVDNVQIFIVSNVNFFFIVDDVFCIIFDVHHFLRVSVYLGIGDG